jgi:hypothetical protein
MIGFFALMLSGAFVGSIAPVCDTSYFDEAWSYPEPLLTDVYWLEPSVEPYSKPSRKVAVLIASDWTGHDKLQHKSAYWYDTVLAYCALRKRGFEDNEIFVLYGHGKDAARPFPGRPSNGDIYFLPYYCGPNGPNYPITDYPMSVPIGRDSDAVAACREVLGGRWRCAPKTIFDCLAKGCSDPRINFFCLSCSGEGIRPLNEDDFLLVWWRGHGSAVGGKANTFELNVGLDWISSSNLEAWIKPINARRRVFIFESCKSGCLEHEVEGWVSNAISDPSTVFVSACGPKQDAEVLHHHDVMHAVFSFWFAGTIRGRLPPNSQNPPWPPNPAISLSHTTPRSAFDAAKEGTIQEVGVTANGPIQEPVIFDPDDLSVNPWP